MVPLIASIAAFAFGLMFLPMLFRGIRVKGGASQALKVGLVGGVASVFGGKVLLALLTLFFFPIVLAGALGAFIVQALVNLAVLMLVPRFMDGVEFDRIRTTGYAALALTVLQILVRLAGN
jgi:uncharacterized membrane protein YvlD (DUF360 family)